MLIWTATIVLILIAAAAWLFLKRDPQRYVHEQSSPINFFFKWGRPCHHFFKAVIIVLFMIAIFSFYRYPLSASYSFSLIAALIAGVVLAAGKELLDKAITLDDVLVSILGIGVASVAILLLF